MPPQPLGFGVPHGGPAHFAPQHYQIPDKDRRGAYSLHAWQGANVTVTQPPAMPMLQGPQDTMGVGLPRPLSAREFGQQPDPFASIVLTSIAELTFGKSSSSPPTLEGER